MKLLISLLKCVIPFSPFYFDLLTCFDQANLNELIKQNSDSTSAASSSYTSPVTYSNIYLRVQPFTTSFFLPEQPATSEDAPSTPASTQTSLQFVLLLTDPTHKLVHTTMTQSVPGNWLELWDKYDWVEDLVAEALRVGVEVIGQEYIVSRMGWGNTETLPKKEVEDEQNVVNEVVAEA